MFKKALISGLVAVMALSMSACGKSKGQEPSQVKDVPSENVQNENAPNETVSEDDAEDIVNDEICQIYFDYSTGVLSEKDTINYLQSMNVTLDEAAAIFDQYGGFLAEELAMAEADMPPYFEAADEIKNASMLHFKLQAADMVFSSFSKVSDCMEKIENSELSFTYEYNPDKLMPQHGGSNIDIYLNDELYMTLKARNAPMSSEDKETRALKDCIVCWIDMKDFSNVYYAGGIPAMDSGISVAEFDELMQKDLGSLMENKQVKRDERLYNSDSYLVRYSFTYALYNYVLECDGAVQSSHNYAYWGIFDETGTKLQKLTLEYDPINNWDYQSYGIQDKDIIIER